MEAVVLAGGKGTRLKPYTADLPKPLVPIGEYPVVEILLRQFSKAGVTRVQLAVNHLAHLVMSVIGNGTRFGLQVEYSVEDKPLSTVAPLKLLTDLPEHFLVANGDILSDLDIAQLYKHHLRSGASLTVAMHERSEKIDFGVLEVSPDDVITGFSEKPVYNFCVSMGIYVFSRHVLDLVPDETVFGFDDLMDLLLKSGERVCAFRHDGYWLDIGRPDDYERALQDLNRIDEWLS
jgi:NDP-sugar pyrophosphorylase family protein